MDVETSTGSINPGSYWGGSTAPRLPVFKPNESFLEAQKKLILWYMVASTSVSAEDAESIRDYLSSGGAFNDVNIPCMYIKKIICV